MNLSIIALGIFLSHISQFNVEMRSSKLKNELEEACEDLRRAYAKLLVVRRIRLDPRFRRGLVFMTIVSRSMVTLPSFMSSMYLRDGLSDLKRARKKLKKILKRSHIPEDLKNQIEKVLGILENPGDDYESIIRSIIEAEKMLVELS